ncbi:hypothetical protein GTP41_08010 [Pseudoduganella sp. DS3]|uniref:Uncharacterized protein n=1 Tax=Pseudoduganella guangdongensis TaxID=2692179 RepID=A0A6N9HF15_9BURK|nr:hypothetical protein [Pseudoduganella guangdongensis]MYN02046.1 hypothetical protein [Pseudoduganella guangdongensis]
MASKKELAALAVAKERLVREGELYRLSTLRSKHEVINALQPQAMLHGAVDQAIGALQARLGHFIGAGGGLSGINFKTALPLLMTAASWMGRRRKLWKPALAVGVLVAAGVTWLVRRKPSDQA